MTDYTQRRLEARPTPQEFVNDSRTRPTARDESTQHHHQE